MYHALYKAFQYYNYYEGHPLDVKVSLSATDFLVVSYIKYVGNKFVINCEAIRNIRAFIMICFAIVN